MISSNDHETPDSPSPRKGKLLTSLLRASTRRERSRRHEVRGGFSFDQIVTDTRHLHTPLHPPLTSPFASYSPCSLPAIIHPYTARKKNTARKENEEYENKRTCEKEEKKKAEKREGKQNEIRQANTQNKKRKEWDVAEKRE